MKPNSQFIQMVSMLFQHRQKSISNDDLIKHNNYSITFYSISKGKFVNERLINKTEAFSEQVLIEIERGANKMIIGDQSSTDVYTRTSLLELTYYDGKGLLHWQAEDSRSAAYVVVKLMADDGTPQIKLISADNSTQIIHNICELPNQ